MKLTGKLEVTSWHEDDLESLSADEGRTTSAKIGYALTGDVVGTASGDVAMHYLPDGTASVVGLLRVVGSIGEKSGGIVFQSVGGYDGTTATGDLTTVPGAGSGDFSATAGTGRTSATSETASYQFELEI